MGSGPYATAARRRRRELARSPARVRVEFGRRGKETAGGESATGISNARYNLVSVLYHALEGGATYDKYIQDAENEGDQELADFFRQVQQEDAQRAQQAKSLLDQR